MIICYEKYKNFLSGRIFLQTLEMVGYALVTI